MYQPTVDAVRIATFISFTLPRWRDVFMRGGMYIPPQCFAFLWDAHTRAKNANVNKNKETAHKALKQRNSYAGSAL